MLPALTGLGNDYVHTKNKIFTCVDDQEHTITDNWP